MITLYLKFVYYPQHKEPGKNTSAKYLEKGIGIESHIPGLESPNFPMLKRS